MDQKQISEKDLGATLALCAFLGLVGAHRLYVGKNRLFAITIGIIFMPLILGLFAGFFIVLFAGKTALENIMPIFNILPFIVLFIWLIVDYSKIASRKYTDAKSSVVGLNSITTGQGVLRVVGWLAIIFTCFVIIWVPFMLWIASGWAV